MVQTQVSQTQALQTKASRRIFSMSFAKLYRCYIDKAERKNRCKEEVDEIITWLTAYSISELSQQLEAQVNVETFFAEAPKFNPNCVLIKGLVCGVRVEEVADPLMQKIRYLDKLIDELAKGKPMEKILRS